MKIVAFAASSSRASINKQLAGYALTLLDGVETELLDLNDFELPLFSVDCEAELGQPPAAREFLERLQGADGLIIALAEHNGSYTAAYKNLFDWMSRIQKKVYLDKKVVLLAAAPGAGGARTVLAAAVGSFPHFGAEVVAQLSVPRFAEVFDPVSRVLTDEVLADRLAVAMDSLKSALDTGE